MRHSPIRTCAGCRRRRPQEEMIRLVGRRDGTAAVDPSSIAGSERRPGARIPGRGAYVCPDERCADRAARSGALRRALGCEGPLPDGLLPELTKAIAAHPGTGGEHGGEEGRHG